MTYLPMNLCDTVIVSSLQSKVRIIYIRNTLCGKCFGGSSGRASIKSFDIAMTLGKDLLLFFVEKGEEEAAEDQQKALSVLKNAEL